MSDTWFVVDSGGGEPAFNMAMDEALLFFGPMINRPVLRFYGWTHPAATFGYFQRYRELEPLTPLRPLIRRTTGGGLVPHDGDWTYSLVLPPGHEWYSWRAAESYRQLHLWLQAAWRAVGVPTQLATEAQFGARGQCFVGAEVFDLVWRERKIAGAAQRRSKHGLLIQGSMQNPPAHISRADWQQAFCDHARQHRDVDWLTLEPSGAMLDLAWKLTAEKYGRPEHNCGR
jgi:lipoate-protein ligase A